MADYYPLIARAIAGLDPSAPGEARRALYERARSALIAQLRSVQPPLSESEITRERLSLEEAVRKVESEAAQRAREASRAGSRSGEAFRAGTPRANPTKPGDAPPPARFGNLVAEMASLLGRPRGKATAQPEHQKTKTKSSEQLVVADGHAFLSYRTEDRQFASQVRDTLGPFGITSFMAHDDTQVSE